MYTGTLIHDLISSVERAEKYSCQTTGSEETSQGYWYTPHQRWRSKVSDSEITRGGINGCGSRGSSRRSSCSQA